MRCLLAIALASIVLAGCAMGPRGDSAPGAGAVAVYDNASLSPIADRQYIPRVPTAPAGTPVVFGRPSGAAAGPPADGPPAAVVTAPAGEIMPPPAYGPIDFDAEAADGFAARVFAVPVLGDFLHDTYLDHQHFYSCRGLTLFTLGLGTAAVLANTNLDQEFQNWYQDRVRTSSTDNFATIAKQFGEGIYAIPVFAGITLLRPYIENDPAGVVVWEWGDRSLRSVVVGGVPVLAFQYILGASRPDSDIGTSHWQPFNDVHGVSGHAFIGAIPFINAAKMSDDVAFKLAMYGLSTLPGWSRINDNAHFLSQVTLGWWLAYLAASAVDESEKSKRDFAVTPVAIENGVGVAMVHQW